MVAAVRRLHDHPAGHDLLVKQAELGRPLPDLGLDRLRRRQVAKRQLQWNLDRPSLRFLAASIAGLGNFSFSEKHIPCQ